jgi:hypothetical protein
MRSPGRPLASTGPRAGGGARREAGVGKSRLGDEFGRSDGLHDWLTVEACVQFISSLFGPRPYSVLQMVIRKQLYE